MEIVLLPILFIVFIAVLYRIIYKNGIKTLIFIFILTSIIGFILGRTVEEAGEAYPYTEIHLSDNKGNVYEIIKMKDGEEVERIVIDESGKRKVVEKSSKSD